MSATVKLASKLPGDSEVNGLDSYAQRLIDQPDDFLMVVAWIDTQKVVTDTDAGTVVPYARIRRIEVLGEADQVSKALRAAVEEAVQGRLGRKGLPAEMGTVSEGFDPGQSTIDEA